MEKFSERLLQVVPLFLEPGDRRALIVDLGRLSGALTKASLSIAERRKLKGVLKKSLDSEDGQKRLRHLIVTLCNRGMNLPSVLGIPVVGARYAHYLKDFVRFRHAMGLADAVHMAMFNTGIRVGFHVPTETRLTECSWKELLLKRNSNYHVSAKGIKVRDKTPFVVLHRSETKHRRFHLLRHYLHVFPKKFQEKDFVKLIKGSLVDAFCVQAEQERPDCPFRHWLPLFPPLTQKRLNKRFATDRRGRVRFYKNLLESKSLCAPVGEDMIREAYEKHYRSLCRPEEEVLPQVDDFAMKLFQYGQTVGEFVEKIYKPHSTHLPNSRATIETNRAAGGARAVLQDRIEIQKGPLYNQMLRGSSRLEPTVVGLFGAPGSGKTTILPSLIRTLGSALFPRLKDKDLVFSRSCACEHWDGYTGQPIVVLDDIGQNLENRQDLVEFEQLVSSNEYHLPMAELSNKGMTFTSPILIVTSNMSFATPLGVAKKWPIVDPGAFWRRFHVPIIVRSEKSEGRMKTVYGLARALNEPLQHRFYRLDENTESSVQISKERSEEQAEFPHAASAYLWNIHFQDQVQLRGRPPYVMEKIFGDRLEIFGHILDCFRHRVDFHASHLSGVWRQNISVFGLSVKQGLGPLYDVYTERKEVAWMENDVTVSLLFNEYPPFHPPVVQAVAIPEPLKVRMITKAEAETKVLQPFQRALFEYLKAQPQFSLTHGVTWNREKSMTEKLEWIHRIEQEIKAILNGHPEGEKLWLSGDYEAATDNFPQWVTTALVEGILSKISHEPTKAWVRYEVSPHVIRYPEGVQGNQTSGQLMGSLLSFPLLCFLNDFIICHSGFEKGSYLINGDDVVARGYRASIEKWRRDAPKVGLSLSLGKNFIDSQFCCVNSQLFWEGDVLHTGKVSCQTRVGKTLANCFSEVQFYYGLHEEIKSEFIRRNLLELRKTPRSLDVPISHGGLGLVFNTGPRFDPKLARRVYLYDYLSPVFKSVAVPGYDFLRAMKVPIGTFTDEELMLGGGEPKENEFLNLLQTLDVNPRESEEVELSFESLLKREKIYSQHERLLNQLSSADFRGFPPLGNIRYRTIFIMKGKVGHVKQRIIEAALTHLLLYSRKIVPDEDESWVAIHRDLLKSEDPLFSDHFPISMEDEPIEEDILPHTSPMVRGGFFTSRGRVMKIHNLVDLTSSLFGNEEPPSPLSDVEGEG